MSETGDQTGTQAGARRQTPDTPPVGGSAHRAARVVVGVDGSPSSDAALRWAENYARMSGATMDIVSAWQFPTYYGEMVPIEGWHPEDDAWTHATKAATTLALPADRARLRVEYGAAGEVLTGVSEGADLLVVGSRGHGGFIGMLLGSVSAHCVHHARCPVVVVR